jgi:hypothetical protein
MRSHQFDAVSLVFGVIFAGIGSLFLMGNDVGDLVTRFWPAAVVLLGLAMLFSARRDEAPVVATPPRPQAWPTPPPAPVAPVRPAEAAAPASVVTAEPVVPPVVAPPAQLPEAEVALEETPPPKPAE